MADENNTPSEEQKGITRRGFLQGALFTVLGVLVVEGLVATVTSLRPKAQQNAQETLITAGKPSTFPVGSVTYFPEGRFYLSHVDAGFLALSQFCTHLGCIVPWRPNEKSEDKLETIGRFNCPCHGSLFDRYGRVIITPATRPMDLHPISIEKGNLVVDVGTVVRRTKYEPSQAVKA